MGIFSNIRKNEVCVGIDEIDSFLSSLESVSDSMNSSINQAQRLVEDLKKKAEKIENTLKKYYEVASKDYNDAINAINSNNVYLAQLETELSSLRSQYNACGEQDAEEKQRINNQMSQISYQIGTINQYNSSLSSIAKNAKTTIDNINKRYGEVQTHMNRIGEQYASFNTTIKKVNDKINTINEESKRNRNCISRALTNLGSASSSSSGTYIDILDISKVLDTANIFREIKQRTIEYNKRQKESGNTFARLMDDDVSEEIVRLVNEAAQNCKIITQDFDEIAEYLEKAYSALTEYGLRI